MLGTGGELERMVAIDFRNSLAGQGSGAFGGPDGGGKPVSMFPELHGNVAFKDARIHPKS